MWDELINLIKDKREEKKRLFNRHVSIQDLLSDRWETAKFCGFGTGSSCYNNVLVTGNVKVGSDTWIGPNVILDGSGGLIIGSFVSISAGAQIYSHHGVEWSRSMGQRKLEYAPTTIGDGVFIGPNAVISKGVSIGDRAVIGAMSFVNKNVPKDGRWYGTSLCLE